MDEDIYEVYRKMIAGQLLTKTYPNFIYISFTCSRALSIFDEVETKGRR